MVKKKKKTKTRRNKITKYNIKNIHYTINRLSKFNFQPEN